jgi:hypothetical protein
MFIFMMGKDEDKAAEKPEKEEKPNPPITIEEPKPISLVEEAKAIRDEILKAKEELKAEREALDKLKSDALLSGTAGARVEVPELSDEEKASRARIKAVADASGSSWGKNYE